MISFCLRLGNNLVRRASTNTTRQKVNTCSKLMVVHGCPQFKTQQDSCWDWLVQNYGRISSFALYQPIVISSLVNCSFRHEQLSPTFSSWLLTQKYSGHVMRYKCRFLHKPPNHVQFYLLWLKNIVYSHDNLGSIRLFNSVFIQLEQEILFAVHKITICWSSLRQIS